MIATEAAPSFDGWGGGAGLRVELDMIWTLEWECMVEELPPGDNSSLAVDAPPPEQKPSGWTHWVKLQWWHYGGFVIQGKKIRPRAFGSMEQNYIDYKMLL